MLGPRKRSLLRDEEGHATAEAVIMLPFFILVWGCIIFVSQGYERAIDVSAKTREHAWAHVMDDCEVPVGAGTEIYDATEPPLGPFGDLFDMVDEITRVLPLVRDYWPDFVVVERKFGRRDTIDKPTILGRGDQRVGHTIVLMCNEAPGEATLEDLAGEAWGAFGL